MADYNNVTPAIVSELVSICGSDHVSDADPKVLDRYARDRIGDPRYGHRPEIVVWPRTADEVADILRLANRELIPVTPRGAGSGLSGGAVPIMGGICLSTERMNRVLEIDTDNMIAVLEPGVVTNELDKELESTGLFFAGYPLSEEFCFIGGNVAENAGGGRAVKYGVTSRYVVGLEVVTAAGELLKIGGKRVKDVTGYDLLHLLVGSEGTLGVFTKIFLRLLPRPKARIGVRAAFSSAGDAASLVPRLASEAGVVPSAAEYIDRLTLVMVGEVLGEVLAPPGVQALLLMECDGHDADSVARDASRLEAVCRDAGAVSVYTATEASALDAMWTLRKQIPWALRRFRPDVSSEDVVVPIAAVPQLLQATAQIAKEYGVEIPCYGHADDGNIHALPMHPEGMEQELWDQMLKKILAEMYGVASDLGGTISGEHGIGHKRRESLPLVLDAANIEIMRSIKQIFDPKGILNPGKIFPS